MNRRALLERLAQACRHIVVGEENIARLREIIARLERGGHDSSAAKELLARFEELQKLAIADRDRLEKELAQLPK
jgi:exonuclease VII small subunit